MILTWMPTLIIQPISNGRTLNGLVGKYVEHESARQLILNVFDLAMTRGTRSLANFSIGRQEFTRTKVSLASSKPFRRRSMTSR